MSRLPRSRRPAGRPRSACVLAALVAVPLSVALLAPSGLAGEPAPLIAQGAGRAEVGLPAPMRYAILRQEPEQVRMLYARGDTIFHPRDPARALTVERVEPETVVLREGPQGRMQALPLGRPIPGFPALTFAGTVLLDQLHYQYRLVDRPTHPDPVLLALEGTRAVLEVEVLRSAAPAGSTASAAAGFPPPDPTPPTRATLDGDLLEKVRVRETRPGLYEVPAADVQAVLDNAGRVLAELWPVVHPSLSLQTGLQYRITSAAGDGVLSGQGFTITAPKLAERAGLQVGDTIRSVNGQPVDGFASLYRIFQTVRQDPTLRTVQVELNRRGTRLTHAYRIR